MALKGGTVVIVGVPAADSELPIRIMQDQQIRVQGSATYVPQDFASAIEMIQAGAVRAEDFIAGQFPLEQAEQAFEASMSGRPHQGADPSVSRSPSFPGHRCGH